MKVTGRLEGALRALRLANSFEASLKGTLEEPFEHSISIRFSLNFKIPKEDRRAHANCLGQ